MGVSESVSINIYLPRIYLDHAALGGGPMPLTPLPANPCRSQGCWPAGPRQGIPPQTGPMVSEPSDSGRGAADNQPAGAGPCLLRGQSH